MKPFIDSLRGYGHETHVKYDFQCQYCGYDGRLFLNWLQLTVDHIIPYNQGGTEKPNNKITVCQACNSITSRMKFPKGLSRKKIIYLKKQRVKERGRDYFSFWEKYVDKKLA